MSFEITVKELKEKLDINQQEVFLLDVRNKDEYDIVNISDSYLIPMDEVEKRLSEIDFSKQVCVLCHHGHRSAIVAENLGNLGYNNVVSVVGGIDSWSSEIDATLPRY